MGKAPRDVPPVCTPALVLDGIHLGFGGPGGPVFAGLCLTVPRGVAVAVLGPSGVGKTSLLRIASGLQVPDAGRVERAPGRVGYAFQEPRLLPWRTVLDNVLLPAGRRPERSVRDRAVSLLRVLGLGEAAGLCPSELSGGMRQRASLARALLIPPTLLLVDEPLGAVHEDARRAMAVTTRRLCAGAAVVWVTHDRREADAVADVVVEMDRTVSGGLRAVGGRCLPSPAPAGGPVTSGPAAGRRDPADGGDRTVGEPDRLVPAPDRRPPCGDRYRRTAG